MSGTSLRGRAALQIDEDRRDAGAREAAQEVELRRLLQLALEPLGDLLQRLVDGRARPCRLHDHGLDDEGRDPRCGRAGSRTPTPASDRDDHQIDDDRAVLERPFREIEAAHGSDPSRRTF